MTIERLDEKVNGLNESFKVMVEKQVEHSAILSKGFNSINEIKTILESNYGQTGAIERGVNNEGKVTDLEKGLMKLNSKVNYTIIIVGIVVSLLPFLNKDVIFTLISKLF